METITTIQISSGLRDFLIDNKLCERETYDEVIRRKFKSCGIEVPSA